MLLIWTSFIGRFVFPVEGVLGNGGGWGISLFLQAASITSSEYMKKWCNIHAIIYRWIGFIYKTVDNCFHK